VGKSALKDALGERIRELEGVECRPSNLGGTDAFHVGGREFVHVLPGDEIDVRLTRTVIRSIAAEIREDARLTLRDRPSDWVEFRFREASDLDRAFELVRMAWEVHR